MAQALRERGHEPQAVAHFVNRLVFCMFADDVGLLPDHMFTRMLRHARPAPERFTELAGDLFEVMATGGRVGFETVAWFNGGLFDDSTTLPLEKSDIETVLAAADLDWSEIDPSILGTLFERGLDPGKRAQLGAHYTDRDKIMLLVEPVVIRPLLVEWGAEKTAIAAELDRAEAAKSSAARTKRRNEAERRLRAFLERLRRFTVSKFGGLDWKSASGARREGRRRAGRATVVTRTTSSHQLPRDVQLRAQWRRSDLFAAAGPPDVDFGPRRPRFLAGSSIW